MRKNSWDPTFHSSDQERKCQVCCQSHKPLNLIHYLAENWEGTLRYYIFFKIVTKCSGSPSLRPTPRRSSWVMTLEGEDLNQLLKSAGNKITDGRVWGPLRGHFHEPSASVLDPPSLESLQLCNQQCFQGRLPGHRAAGQGMSSIFCLWVKEWLYLWGVWWRVSVNFRWCFSLIVIFRRVCCQWRFYFLKKPWH